MKTLTKQSSHLFILVSILSLLFSISSCTAIRSTDSNNFTRVKYNPHLKFKKSVEKTTVEENKIEKLVSHKLTTVSTEQEEKTVKQPLYKTIQKKDNGELTAEATVKKEAKKVKLTSLLNPSHSSQTEGGFINNWSQLIPATNIVLEPMASDSDLGTLIWIILAVLLVLLLLSILAELGGGLIGTLLAVLLILLILRLLGII